MPRAEGPHRTDLGRRAAGGGPGPAGPANRTTPIGRCPGPHKAYVVETLCRALYTLARGQLLSKRRAVAWALETLPEPWRSTVERSQAWRTDDTVDPSIVPEVRRFVLWTASDAQDPASVCLARS